MTKIQQTIGRLPVFKGEYIDGTWYKEKHRVTHLGSEFQAKQEGYLAAPVTVALDGKTAVFNTDQWYIISNGTDAFLLNEQVQKVYIITETAWAELQEDAEAFSAFCQAHKRWSVDVVEDGYIPPTPSESSYDEVTGIITADGTYDEATGIVTLNGTYDDTTGIITI